MNVFKIVAWPEKRKSFWIPLWPENLAKKEVNVMLRGKTVVLGVTGSIAAYKMADVASALVKQHAKVHVIMTKNACHFINPIAFESLTNTKCLVETFDRNFQFHVAHVSVAQEADVMLLAPASANIIAKLANGLADDMLSTTVLAASCPKLIAPAMNTHMLENPIVQDNLKKCESYGMKVIPSDEGHLACGATGKGKLPSMETLLSYIYREIAKEKDLSGKKVLVTAGPTQEPIDPVRYITNHSSGKMGYAIARQAMLRGAEVTLVTGPVSIPAPLFVDVVPVITAEEMYQAVTSRAEKMDVIIKAAAVADYTPKEVAAEKTKKKDGDMSIPLVRTKDILKELGQNRRKGQVLCGFSMETENMEENSKKKLVSKNLDLIVANNLKDAGAGFQTDTNKITIFSGEGKKEYPLMTKDEAADVILDECMARGGIID